MKQKMVILWYYLKYRYLTRFKNRKKLEIWQNRKIRQHLKTIVKRSEYYKKLYEVYDLSDIQRLPIINKQEMMANFSQLNTVGIVKEEAESIAIQAEIERHFESKINGITVGLSSGTSGNRGVFLASDKERFMWSGAILAKTLPSGLFSREKIAFFLRANSNLYETVKSNQLSFQYFDTFADVSINLKELNDYQPTILVAPASQLLLIAKAQQSGGLKLNCKKIIAVAEVLEDIDKQYMSTVFNQRIEQVYQATEGFLASTCSFGNLHLNEDIVHIEKEYVDIENHRFIPVITDFTRLSQPILRYRLNDVLVEDLTPCPCGSCFTVLSHIEGRTDDMFYGWSEITHQAVPIFSDFIRRAILIASSNIEAYRVVQSSYNELCVYVSLKESETQPNELKQLIEHEIISIFKSLNCTVPIVTFEDHFNLQKGQKLRRIERTFSIEK